jgi:predicted phosphoadenosine phosphosulfate sulfurtransferase
VNGCDSTVTLHLTIHPAETYTFDESACVSYQWNDSTYYESGEYIQHFETIHGCDSTVTLHLSILPYFSHEFKVTTCDLYQWNDSIYTTSGDYVQQLVSSSGCDSTVTLHLTINNSVTGEFADTACASYAWNDSIYVASGDYTQHFTAANGCDSTVTLHLTIYPAETTDFEETACSNFLWNDSLYTTSGDYVQHFQTIHGCDSTVTLHLTIRPAYTHEFAETACTSYLWNDSLYTASGDYIQHFQTIHGCDSTVTLHLTILPTYSIDTTVNICDVDLPFVWNNSEYFDNGGLHILQDTSVGGCDSIIRLTINVHPTFSGDTNVTVCQGALPYYFDADHSFSQGGVYNINLLTASGCDSIFHLHLTVTPNAEHDATQTICDSQLPYTFMGQQFDTAGTYDITESNGDNCLTITHFTLNVNPTYHHFDTVTVCQEALPYLYGSTPLPDSGSYDIHFSSALTCDSLVTVLLNVIPTAAGADELFVCGSDFPVSYGDSSFSVAGTYEVVFHRDGLCDSLVTLTLHQAQEYAFADTDFVCDHELPYLWRGMAFNESGIYYDSLTTGHGCDSVYSLNLTVNATQLVVSDPIVLCDGVSEIWRGMVLSEAGTYRDTVIAASGCHEIHEVSVTVNPSYHFFDTVTLCSDELPYLWHDMTVSEAGTREDYHQTAGTFCDSVYHLTLYVNPSYHVTESASACDYDLPYLWHGQSLGASGVYHDTLVTADGCDSTFTLTFTVNASQHEVLADTVCQNALPYAWRGHQINAAGNYADTIPNATGCMDVFELHLSVLQSDVTTIYDTVCAGSLYDLHGFDTLALLPGTLYDQMTLANADGCDSVVNLVLAVLPSYFFEESAQTCENVPYLWHGNELIVEGTYYDSLLTASGCDSVFVLHLSLNPTYDVYVSDSAVREHLYTFDSLNSFVITPADSGTFFYDIQFYTLAHCDSIVHLTLFVAFNDGVEDFSFEPDFSFYPNPTQAMLNIKGQDMKRVDVFNLNGKLVLSQMPDTPEFTQLDVARFATGHYLVKVLLNDGRSVTGKIIVNRR